MHPLSEPIYEINSNLESLRDFVDILDAHLREKAQESFSTHSPSLEFLVLILEKLLEDGDSQSGSATAEKIKEIRAKYPEVLSAETKHDTNNIEIKFKLADDSTIETDKLNAAIKEILRAQGRTQMLYSSSLMTLASSIELFFSKFFHQYFHLYPESISSKEKIFSFDDLAKFDTLVDARTHYISSKIEDLLRGSINDWFLFARNNLKLSMGYLKEEQELLEETFQRRNIVVHNGGIANSIYIAKVPKSLCKNIKIGDNLTPDRKYLSERIDLWEKNCILIAAELWKNLAREDLDRAHVLGEINYKHLLAGRWSVSASLSTFLVQDKQMPEGVLLSAQLNYWQCQKRIGRWNDVCAEVKMADYSAKSLRYQLAHLALLGNVDEFYFLLPRALSTGEMTEKDLREYPIFIDMRNDSRFETYKEKLPKKKIGRRKKIISGSDQNV